MGNDQPVLYSIIQPPQGITRQKETAYLVRWTALRVPLKMHISLQYFVVHKKYFLIYRLYTASIFFVLALSCLEIRILEAPLRETKGSDL